MVRFILWLIGSLLTRGIFCFLCAVLFLITGSARIHKIMWHLYQSWVGQLSSHVRTLIPNIEVAQEGDLDVQGAYIIIANHYSWLDILILYTVLYGRAPGFVFVMKRSLLKLPMIGIICWGLGHPLMRKDRKRKGGRLLNHWALEGAVKKAVECGYGIAIFPEGTRYNIYDQLPKTSYRNLLNPKASGLNILVENMPMPVTVVDVSLAYKESQHKIVDFLLGRVSAVHVRISQHYLAHTEVKNWLRDRWLKKDAHLHQDIQSLLAGD